LGNCEGLVLENEERKLLAEGKIVGSLRTVDGMVYLRSDMLETFEIAEKLLKLIEKRIKGEA